MDNMTLSQKYFGSFHYSILLSEYFDLIDLITFWTHLTYVRDSSGYVGVKYLLQHFIFKKLSELKKNNFKAKVALSVAYNYRQSNTKPNCSYFD